MIEFKKIDIANKKTFYILLLLVFALKVFVAFFSFPGLLFGNEMKEITELSFGNGGFIKSLLETMEYKNEVSKGVFFYGHRMPGLPFFVALLGLISKKQLIVSILKSLVFSLLTFKASKLLVSINGIKFYYVINFWLILFVVFPNLIKEMIELNYEDAFLLEIISLLTLFLISNYKNNLEETLSAIPYILILGFLSFFLKSSMLILFLYSVIFSFYYISIYWKIAFLKISITASIFLIIISLSLWGTHNYNHRGKFTFLTSYKGENFYNSANEENYLIYPEYLVDILYYGKDTLTLTSGKKIIVSEKPNRFTYFKNEQAWSDYYEKKGFNWIKNNPKKYFDFGIKKIKHYFTSIKAYPLIEYPDNAFSKKRFRNVFQKIQEFWLFFGRILSGSLIFLLGALILKKQYFNIINYSLIISSYSLPYIIGYSHTRHINIFLIICSIIFFKVLFLKEHNTLTYKNIN